MPLPAYRALSSLNLKRKLVILDAFLFAMQQTFASAPPPDIKNAIAIITKASGLDPLKPAVSNIVKPPAAKVTKPQGIMAQGRTRCQYGYGDAQTPLISSIALENSGHSIGKAEEKIGSKYLSVNLPP